MHSRFSLQEQTTGLEKQIARLNQALETKLNRDIFQEYRLSKDEQAQTVNEQLDRKSNIKDVCALLDLKSSKY